MITLFGKLFKEKVWVLKGFCLMMTLFGKYSDHSIWRTSLRESF
jgi:hypothetical protein